MRHKNDIVKDVLSLMNDLRAELEYELTVEERDAYTQTLERLEEVCYGSTAMAV